MASQLWVEMTSQLYIVLALFSHSIYIVLFGLAVMLMVPHCSLDGSGGMPPVPPRFSMSAYRNRVVIFSFTQ